MPRAVLAALVLVGLFGLGCASASESGGAPLELGTGTVRFEPLEDEQRVPMVKGAQGGWHIWLAVRTADPTVATGSLTIELQPADESAPPQTTSLGIQLDPPDASGGRSYLGWPAILPDPSCAVDRLLRVRATFTTGSGERWTAERYVLPAPGDDPPPPCAG